MKIDVNRFRIGYYLAREGQEMLPPRLKAATWKEGYGRFFDAIGNGQEFGRFCNSIKGIRDSLDGHFPNGRVGYRRPDGSPDRKLLNRWGDEFRELEAMNKEDIFDLIEPLINYSFSTTELTFGENPRKAKEPNAPSYPDHLADLFIGEELKEALQRSILRKKNIILQGPPGTGKTFIAKRLARHLGGSTVDGSIEMVQFHQSFGYEDFVMGYRPGENGFEAHEGIFPEFCRRAEGDPDTPHFLIIDEINRGNLSRILGELMVLIEHDKRGSEHGLRLGRSEGPADRFHVPANLHIIGTMNTADRSLGRVDYALRRRFHFHSIPPCFDASMRDHLIDLGCPAGLASHVTLEMTAMNNSIADPEGDLGPGFEIGHSYFCDAPEDGDWNRWLADIIDLELIPLLREYWYDKPVGDTDEFVEDLRNHQG